MRVARLKSPASLANLRVLEEGPPRAPGAGELLVRIRANSQRNAQSSIAATCAAALWRSAVRL